MEINLGSQGRMVSEELKILLFLTYVDAVF